MSRLIQEHEEGILRVKLSGQFVGGEETDSLAIALKDEHPADTGEVVLDMDGVTYMNSTALGVLIGSNSHLKRKGIKMVIVNLPENIHELFKMTKLDKLFAIN